MPSDGSHGRRALAARLLPSRRPGRRPRARGQSLVEFALILPALLLLTLIAVDFGRVYLGWINLQNMTRIAANFAANHPSAWLTNDPTAIATRTQYGNQITSDAQATNCTLTPATPASPTFSDADGDGVTTGVGDHATVALTCTFRLITPVISAVLGGSIPVSASAVFPVKSGLSGTSSGSGCVPPTAAINANPVSGFVPLTVHFTDASGGGAADTWSWTIPGGTPATSTARDPGDVLFSAAGTYVVTMTATNVCGSTTTNPGTTIVVTTPSAPPSGCVVPDFNNVRRNNAQSLWGLPKPPGAGFTTTVQDGPGAPNGNYTIHRQSIVAATTVPCNSTIQVNN